MNDATTSAPRDIVIELSGATLGGELAVPAGARGLVVFVHGSGSSRFSPRNRQVARYFNGEGLATLLFDLLTGEEHRVDERTREFRFDIPLLANRLAQVLDWLAAQPALAELRTGLFGASTGAAAALIAAAERPAGVAAVVSRGGRTDLAGAAVTRVAAPVLLIVGEFDEDVLELNRATAAALCAPHELSVVPGATHLFEEPGALDAVARLAGDWFSACLR